MTVPRKVLMNMIFLALAAALLVAPYFIKPGAKFAGTDNLAVQEITQLRPDYKPWVQTLWEPPDGEVESLLFALQAALGAGFIGYYFISQKHRKKKPGHDNS